MSFRKMNVLVTGAGGFSGSAATLALLQLGHSVTALVRSTIGRLPPDAGRYGDLQIIAGNLASEMALPKRLDAVVHAAARLSSVTDNDLIEDNVKATDRLVAHAKRSGVTKFIYLSSLSVYGRIESPIVDESTPMVSPEPYGRTKRLGEELVAAGSDRFASLAIRLPGIIGRRSVRNWLSGLLEAAREGRDITIFNPHAPFNNAVHVSELADFVGVLLGTDWDGFDAITTGAAGQTAVRDVVKLLVEAFGDRSRIKVAPAKKPSFLVSSARARERYGYNSSDITAMLRRFAAENIDT